MNHRKQIVTDTINRQIEIGFPPQRIVSLVPSITELLFDLGLEKEIVGITKFCVHPAEKIKTTQKIGGTKDFSIEKIIDLQPDLVVADKAENTKDAVLKLAEKVPVFVTDVIDFISALQMIKQIGAITDRQTQAINLSNIIQSQFDRLTIKKPHRKAIYLIWRKPYMTVNGNTFINAMMGKAGFENIFAGKSDNYPVITGDEIKNSGAEVVLLSSEPYHFTRKHITEFRTLLPTAEIRLVDGEMFTWYGSRMRLAAKYFSTLQV